jgi:hypothetical protein
MNEKENTARMLREEPTLVTGFWCRFRLHSWTKWSKTTTCIGVYDVQVKHCGHCNIMHTRKVLPR